MLSKLLVPLMFRTELCDSKIAPPNVVAEFCIKLLTPVKVNDEVEYALIAPPNFAEFCLKLVVPVKVKTELATA